MICLKNARIRLSMYLIGLFVMTLGIAISVKSDLGVSPVSSIPYTITCVWGLEMGKATILFHCILVVLQLLLLRKRFQVKNLLQVVVGILFGYFTTFCNYCVSFLPDPGNIVIKLLMMLGSAVLIAFGIFLYVPADIMPLAGEGFMKTVSDMTKREFSKVKIAFDVTMVVISLMVCLAVLHKLGSVGLGTVISAVLVGAVLGVITRLLGARRDRLLKPEETRKKLMEVCEQQ